MAPLSECVYLPVVNASEFPTCYEFLCHDDETDVLHTITIYDKAAAVGYFNQARNWSQDTLGNEMAVLPCYFVRGEIRAHMPRIYADRHETDVTGYEDLDILTGTGYSPLKLLKRQLKTIYLRCTHFYGIRISRRDRH